MVPRRQVKHPYTKDTIEYVVDRREKQNGTQSASQEIVQAGSFDQKMTDWLPTLPAAAERPGFVMRTARLSKKLC